MRLELISSDLQQRTSGIRYLTAHQSPDSQNARIQTEYSFLEKFHLVIFVLCGDIR